MAPKEGSMDEAISNLKEILTAVQGATLQMESLCGEIETTAESRTALLEEVKGDWGDLIKAADSFHEGVEEGGNETDTELDEATQAVAATLETVESLALVSTK